jgi:hypothetical protein
MLSLIKGNKWAVESLRIILENDLSRVCCRKGEEGVRVCVQARQFPNLLHKSLALKIARGQTIMTVLNMAVKPISAV